MRPSLAGMKGRRFIFAACLAGGGVLYLLSAAIFPRETRRLRPGRDATIIFLHRTANAGWIRAGRPLDLVTKDSGEAVVFRRLFAIAQPTEAAVLTVRALGEAEAFLDGRSLGRADAGRRPWDAPALFEIPRLEPGEHELGLGVRHPFGPALVLAECPGLGLGTDARWVAGPGQGPWSPAVPAESGWDVPLAREFEGGAAAFLRTLPLLAPLFVLAFFLARRSSPDPRTVRFAILGALALLGLNNMRRLPAWIGFDAISHMRYIQTVAANGRLPAPDSDWQAFQAPLYYLLSAPLWSLFSRLFGYRLARFLVRVVPLACGLLQAELSYRAARGAYPERKDLQTVAVAVGGLLPMGLYMSQVASNEPLAGCLSAAVIVLALSLRAGEPARRRDSKLAFMGALLGLALLTKITALLLIPPLLMLLWARTTSRSPVEKISDAALLLGAAFAVCGWYYVRNQLQYGRPFFMPSIDPSWWQDPGYRTAGQFFSFGRALAAPVYAAAAGFWDSIYSSMWLDGYLSGTASVAVRPPWNYSLMISCAWLALVPSALLAAGAASALSEPAVSLKNGFLAVVGWIAVFLAAMLYVYATLPNYTAAKASYMLGLTPCFALLAARGFDALVRRGASKAALSAALACWAFAGYLSYFVVTPFIGIARP